MAEPKSSMLEPGCFGVSVYAHDAMPAECNNCPFKKEREGEPYLDPERMEAIKFAVAMGQPFYCHKTVYQKGVEQELDPETGDAVPPDYDRKYKPCRGAVNYAIALAQELGVEPEITR